MRPKTDRVCGTMTKYRQDKCRCDACAAAARFARTKYRSTGQTGFGIVRLPAKTLVEFVKAVDDETIAMVIGVHPERIRKWRSQNIGLDKYAADRYANNVGVHPSAIWGNDWFKIPFGPWSTDSE